MGKDKDKDRGKSKDKDKKDKDRQDKDRRDKEESRERESDALQFEAHLPLPQVLQYLDNLREKLAGGELEVRSGDTVVTLRPQGTMRLRVGADESSKRHRVRFDISWDPNPAPILEFTSVGSEEVTKESEKEVKAKNGRDRASK